MCERTSKGYKMQDGTEIHFGEKLENIDLKYLNQLNEQPSSALEFFLINSNLIDIKKSIEDISAHGSGCPINVEGVKKIARKEIDETPKRKWKESGWIVKAITSIALLGSATIGFLIAYKEFFK